MTVRVAVDGRWGLVVMVACFVAQALSCGISYSFGVVYVELLKEFNQSESATAWIGSTQAAVLDFSGLFTGPLVNKYGGRTIGAVGAIITAVGYLTSSLASNIYVLYLTFGFIGGLGMGLMYITAAIVVHLYVDRWRSVANGIACAGASVGTMVMAPMSRWLFNELGWRLTLIVQGSMTLTGILCAVTYLPVDNDNIERQCLVHHKSVLQEKLEPLEPCSEVEATVTRYGIDNEEGRNRVDLNVSSAQSGVSTNDVSELDDDGGDVSRQPTASLIKSRPFLTFLIATALYAFGIHVTNTYLPVRSEIVCGIGSDRSALLLTVMCAGSTVGRLVTGFGFTCCYSDVIGTCRLSTLKLVTTAAAAVLTGLMSTLMFAMNDYATTMIYALAVGFFQGSWIAINSLVVVDMIGIDKVVHAVSLTWFAFSLGVFFGSPLTGWMVKVMDGDYNAPFAIIGSVQIVGGLLYFSTRFCVWPTASKMSSH